uniref:nucleoporin NUP35 isoform X1 n=2 Tax=Myxine glutinosa TaxID=7769 RepID=UPI00358ECA25
MDFQGAEPMTLGSPTSPKACGTQFLPGFLLGDPPTPSAAQQRPFSNAMTAMEVRSPLAKGRTPPQPVLPVAKDKSGAPPVRGLYDDLASSPATQSPFTPRQRLPLHSPLSSNLPCTPCSGTFSTSVLSSSTEVTPRPRKTSPAQADPFYRQGESLSSEDVLNQTWITIFGFPPASASYILMQFAQYGNVIRHVMASDGNWMHVQYQSKLQARKALGKDGKVFGDCIMVGVKPCIDKNIMENVENRNSTSGFGTPVLKQSTITHAVSQLTPRQSNGVPKPSSMRSLGIWPAGSDLQVVTNKLTPRKDESLLSKAMEYVFGW